MSATDPSEKAALIFLGMIWATFSVAMCFSYLL